MTTHNRTFVVNGYDRAGEHRQLTIKAPNEAEAKQKYRGRIPGARRVTVDLEIG